MKKVLAVLTVLALSTMAFALPTKTVTFDGGADEGWALGGGPTVTGGTSNGYAEMAHPINFDGYTGYIADGGIAVNPSVDDLYFEADVTLNTDGGSYVGVGWLHDDIDNNKNGVFGVTSWPNANWQGTAYDQWGVDFLSDNDVNGDTIGDGNAWPNFIKSSVGGPVGTVFPVSHHIEFSWDATTKIATLILDGTPYTQDLSGLNNLDVTLTQFGIGYIKPNGSPANVAMTIDNATYSVPEPATMSVLGLGALVALRRRR